jgi:hypothetical protein
MEAWTKQSAFDTTLGAKYMRLITTVSILVAAAIVVAGDAVAQNGNQMNPAKTCTAQRTAMGEQAFKQLYGTNANRSNAFGKCVSKQARMQEANELNASQTCRAERETLGEAAFAAKYGKNKNDKNAFGKCVSQHAQTAQAAQQQATIKAAKACKAERGTLGAEAFKNKYGTNRNKANAFGKCVSKRTSG